MLRIRKPSSAARIEAASGSDDFDARLVHHYNQNTMNHTFEEIAISTGDTLATIAPGRGAIVTSFTSNQTEILYLDRETFEDANKNVRGGIPLLFPNAGPLKGGVFNLPQHGFARRMLWNVFGQKPNSMTLKLLSNAETLQNYPFDFELILNVEVQKNKLNHIMTVKNTGNKPMPTAYGLHPYFSIPQPDKHELRTNIPGFDPQAVNWLEEFDRSFPNPGLIRLTMPGRKITIETDPAIFQVARIWHLPGKNFICFEPWTRDNFALDDPEHSLWVQPHASVNLSMAIIYIDNNDNAL
jgi:galactose mutarotase-like enzyme